MITFLDKQYAKNDREMIVTLFNGTRTANGFYRKTKNGIYSMVMFVSFREY